MGRNDTILKILDFALAAPSFGFDGVKVCEINAGQYEAVLVLFPCDTRIRDVSKWSGNVSAWDVLRTSAELQATVVLRLVSVQKYERFPFPVRLAHVSYVGESCHFG